MRRNKKTTANLEIETRRQLLDSIDMNAPGLFNVLEEFGVEDLSEFNTIPFSILQEIAEIFDVIEEKIFYRGE